MRDADQVAVHQRGFFAVAQLADLDRAQADLALVPALGDGQRLLRDRLQIGAPSLAGNGRPGEIARQPGAGGQDDIGFPAGFARPGRQRRRFGSRLL